VLPNDELSGDDLDLLAGCLARSEAMGEPWKTRLGPRELAEQLVRLGVSEVFHLTPELAQQRYFAGRHRMACEHLDGSNSLRRSSESARRRLG
jgi:hypothetical protein